MASESGTAVGRPHNTVIAHTWASKKEKRCGDEAATRGQRQTVMLHDGQTLSPLCNGAENQRIN
jgi:hypothetical protein